MTAAPPPPRTDSLGSYKRRDFPSRPEKYPPVAHRVTASQWYIWVGLWVCSTFAYSPNCPGRCGPGLAQARWGENHVRGGQATVVRAKSPVEEMVTTQAEGKQRRRLDTQPFLGVRRPSLKKQPCQGGRRMYIKSLLVMERSPKKNTHTHTPPTHR